MSDRTKKVGRVLATIVVWGLLVAAGFVLIGEAVEDSDATAPAPTLSGQRTEPCLEADRACYEYNDIRESEVQRPTAAHLMAEHGCWLMRDGAPANVDGIPGGAVVRVDGADPEYSENATLIAWAMDAYYDSADNGVEPIAFCRGDQ